MDSLRLNTGQMSAMEISVRVALGGGGGIAEKIEEIRKRECGELSELMGQAVDVMSRNERLFEAGGQYHNLSGQWADLLWDSGSLIVNAGSTGLGIYSMGADKRLRLDGQIGEYGVQWFTGVTPAHMSIVNNIGLGVTALGIGIDARSLYNAVGAGDEANTWWSMFNVTSGGLGLAATAINPAFGIALGVIQIAANTAKANTDMKALVATMENAARAHDVIQSASARLVDLEDKMSAKGCSR